MIAPQEKRYKRIPHSGLRARAVTVPQHSAEGNSISGDLKGEWESAGEGTADRADI